VWLLKNEEPQPGQWIWTVCTMIANFAICFLGWWRCFANNYLHWAAGTTWLLLIAQGNSAHSLSLSLFLSLSVSLSPFLFYYIRVSINPFWTHVFCLCVCGTW
jgi:hypothetical protein